MKFVLKNTHSFINNALQKVHLFVENGKIIDIIPDNQEPEFDGRIMDMEGAYIYPAFTDGHNHPARRSRTLKDIDLRNGIYTTSDVLDIIRNAVSKRKNGEWIVLHGWKKEWGIDSKSILDEITINIPIFLFHTSYHAGLLNTAGLKWLESNNIDFNHHNGFVDEEDFEIVENAVALSVDEYTSYITEYIQKIISTGVVEVHDMLVSNLSQLKAYQRIFESQTNIIDTFLYLDARFVVNFEKEIKELLTDSVLKEYVLGIKVFMDGTLGTHQAALYDRYSDHDGNGEIRIEKNTFTVFLESAQSLNLTDVAIHCIGDRGIDQVLKLHSLYAERFSQITRWRLEHCELPSDDAIAYMSKYGIVASIQPNFLWDCHNYFDRLGERISRVNPFAKLQKANVPVIFGSDDMPTGPIDGIDWALHRNISPDQVVDISVLIENYTVSYKNNMRSRKLEVGGDATFVVLDKSLDDESRKLISTYKLGICIGGIDKKG